MAAKNRLVVVVIFGGASSEHEVSLASASTVIEALDQEKYDILKLGINKQGCSYLYSGDISKIKSGEWVGDLDHCIKAFITPDGIDSNLILVDEGKGICQEKRVDVVIPVLHGKNGEDGTIQGLLDLSTIPYVGCKTLTSAVCMDKVVTNILLKEAGIDQAKFGWFYSYQYKKDPDECIRIAESVSEYPLFVKPANAGSSVGISKVHNREELIQGIENAIKEDSKILIEESITGHEVECAVLGNEDPIASVLGEIAYEKDEFYDYEHKYQNKAKLYIPARINEEISNSVRETAIKAYKFLGCRGLTRMDFFVDEEDNKIYLNEPNTFPGFTEISMYPKLFEATGIKISDLLDKLIEFALQK